MKRSDYEKHIYAKNKADKAVYKPIKDLSGFYIYNTQKMELKPVHPTKIKIHSIRLPYNNNVPLLWVNHKNYFVEECPTFVTIQDNVIGFKYNSTNYLISRNENNNIIIEKL